jgi:TusA-related sulfurtransferase
LIEVSSSVDARGSAGAGALLEAKMGIGKVKVGEVLEIYADDSGTRTDIPAWSNKVSHEYPPAWKRGRRRETFGLQP